MVVIVNWNIIRMELSPMFANAYRTLAFIPAPFLCCFALLYCWKFRYISRRRGRLSRVLLHLNLIYSDNSSAQIRNYFCICSKNGGGSINRFFVINCCVILIWWMGRRCNWTHWIDCLYYIFLYVVYWSCSWIYILIII